MTDAKYKQEKILEPEDTSGIAEDASALTEDSEMLEGESEVSKGNSLPSLWILIATVICLGFMVVLVKLSFEISALKNKPSEFMPEPHKEDSYMMKQIEESQKNLSLELQLLKSTQQSITDELKTFQSDIDELHATTSRTNVMGFSLAELNYLIEKANFKLNYENDIKGTLAILKLIQEKAKDPGLLHFNNHLINLIHKLEPYAKLDISEILSKLQQLETTLVSIPIRLSPTDMIRPEQAAHKIATSWQDKFWESIREIIVVQKINRPVKPVIHEHEEALIHYQMKLKVRQAEMALMTHQYLHFQAALRDLKIFSSDYIDFKKEENSALEGDFDVLLTQQFPSSYPDVKHLHQELAKHKVVS